MSIYLRSTCSGASNYRYIGIYPRHWYLKITREIMCGPWSVSGIQNQNSCSRCRPNGPFSENSINGTNSLSLAAHWSAWGNCDVVTGVCCFRWMVMSMTRISICATIKYNQPPLVFGETKSIAPTKRGSIIRSDWTILHSVCAPPCPYHWRVLPATYRYPT